VLNFLGQNDLAVAQSGVVAVNAEGLIGVLDVDLDWVDHSLARQTLVLHLRHLIILKWRLK
jgi:hypothetical protein